MKRNALASLIDVNVLLALMVEDHYHTKRALHWLREQKPKSVFICRIVQMGALRLLSKPSVMKNEWVSPSEFWRMWERLIRDKRIDFAREPSNLESEWQRITISLAPGESAGTDSYLAAFASAGGYSLVTFDKGMTRFRKAETVILT